MITPWRLLERAVRNAVARGGYRVLVLLAVVNVISLVMYELFDIEQKSRLVATLFAIALGGSSETAKLLVSGTYGVTRYHGVTETPLSTPVYPKAKSLATLAEPYPSASLAPYRSCGTSDSKGSDSKGSTLKAAGKMVKDVDHCLAKFMQISAWYGDVAKGYVQGKLYVHVHLGLRSLDRRPESQYRLCAVLYGANVPGALHGDMRITEDVRRLFSHSDVSTRYDLVLVDHRQSMQNLERVTGWVATLVRLQRLDHGECLVINAKKRRLPVTAAGCLDISVELPLVGGDGKTSAAARRFPEQHDDLPHQMVKRGPQVVDVVTDDDTPARGKGRTILKPDGIPAGFVVRLQDEVVGVCVEKVADVGIERCKVEVCALDLGSDANKGMTRLDFFHEGAHQPA